MRSASPVEHRVTLGEILDQDALQRICMSFARLYRTGLAVVDVRGQALLDIPAEHAVCRRISAHRGGLGVCAAQEDLVHLGGADDGRECACGLRFETLPIVHDNGELGSLVLGPYRPEDLDEPLADLAEALTTPDGEPDQDALECARDDLHKLPQLASTEARQLILSLGQVLEVIVQSGYARHVTSQIHVATIQDAYNELQIKNRELAEHVEKLKELDKLKSNFLATVSHELRTPLTSVIGYSEMLIEGLAGDLNEQQKDYVYTVMEKGEQLLHIINGILDLSKIESGSLQLHCERFKLQLLLDKVNASMLPQARRRKITLTYKTPDDLPEIVADQAKTRQVVLNLVANAVKFTPAGGTVEASAVEQMIPGLAEGMPRRRGIEIRVCDTGIGIPEEARSRIFEAFHQVDNTSTRQFGGTGLGLSIVKHFVEAHGGSVWVEENVGGGSVFVVQLPLSPPEGTLAAEAVGRTRAAG